MHREHVNLVGSYESIDDALGLEHDFPDQGIVEFRNGSTRFGKRSQSICCGDESSDDDRRIVRGVLTNEGADAS